jgi:hypothetical protein
MLMTLRIPTVFILLASGLAIAQTPVSAPRPPLPALDFNKIPRPPMPTDPMELVTGAAQPVQDAQQRIAAIGLLEKAHELSNLRAQPYDLKTSFIAYGGLASDGSWSLEDASRAGKYRWTATGPNYSAINLYPDRSTNGLYSNQESGILPLRLLQVRSAIFFIYPTPGPQASIRTATGFLNNVPQNCVLVVIGAGSRSFSGARNWEESEYCVDSKTGLLSQYSPAPGVFVRYDYSSAIRFHNTFVPMAFNIFENGQVVAEVRTINIADPPAATDPMFDTAGLRAVGSGRAMNPGANLPIMIPAPGKPFVGVNANTAMQVVALHGNIAGDGHLSEIEVLASTDPALNQAAVEQAASFARIRVPAQPGATAQSSEIFLTFEFITPGA